MITSSNELLRTMANDLVSVDSSANKASKLTAASSKLKEDSISKQFTFSLRKLYETLDATAPHYVRCIKPNHKKLPNCFMAQHVLLQLQYAGMIETIRIRQQGYSLRLPHHQFFHRYSCVDPQSATLVELVNSLSTNLAVGAESWQLGATKIFIRRDMTEKLDRLLWVRMSSSCRIVQRAWRFKLATKVSILVQTAFRRRKARNAYRKLKKATLRLQTFVRQVRCVKSFRATVRALILLQSRVRVLLAKSMTRKLRNPYNRMSYEELSLLIKENSKKLDTLMVEIAQLTNFVVRKSFVCRKQKNSPSVRLCR